MSRGRGAILFVHGYRLGACGRPFYLDRHKKQPGACGGPFYLDRHKNILGACGGPFYLVQRIVGACDVQSLNSEHLEPSPRRALLMDIGGTTGYSTVVRVGVGRIRTTRFYFLFFPFYSISTFSENAGKRKQRIAQCTTHDTPRGPDLGQSKPRHHRVEAAQERPRGHVEDFAADADDVRHAELGEQAADLLGPADVQHKQLRPTLSGSEESPKPTRARGKS